MDLSFPFRLSVVQYVRFVKRLSCCLKDFSINTVEGNKTSEKSFKFIICRTQQSNYLEITKTFFWDMVINSNLTENPVKF